MPRKKKEKVIENPADRSLLLDSLLDDRDEKEVQKKTRAKLNKPPKEKKKKVSKKELELKDIADSTYLPENYETVWTEEQLQYMCDFVDAQTYIAVDTETTGVNVFINEIVGFSIFTGGRGFYVPLTHVDDINTNPEARARFNDINPAEAKNGVNYICCLPKELVINYVKPLLEDRSKKFILHNSKFDQHILYNWMGIRIIPYFDTLIAAALLNENISKSLKELSAHYLDVTADKFNKLFGKLTFDKAPLLINAETRMGNIASYYAIKDTEMTLRLYEFFIKHIDSPRLTKIKKLFYEVEMPFADIVWKSEQQGVRFDTEYMKTTVVPVLETEAEELRAKIMATLGDVNLRSPVQLAEALYVKLNLPRVNDKKPNSTDKKTLSKLAKKFPIVQNILDFRKKSKLLDSFGDKLCAKVINGRINTSFSTVGTKTGRLASKQPNLQQIPAGNLIRNAFLADEGRLLASIDFSGQEVRVLAHVSKDQLLLDIFANNKDFHSMTAVMVYNLSHFGENVDYETLQYCRSLLDLFCDKDGNNITNKIYNEKVVGGLVAEGRVKDYTCKELEVDVNRGKAMDKSRKKAKTINFGIIYGIQSRGLSDQLDVSEKEAQGYIDGFFKTYKGVARWMAEIRQKVARERFTETMLGRKRRLYEEVDSGQTWLLHSAFRQGGNFVIQGTSADQTKLATVLLQPLLEELDIKTVLFIHDEIIFDVPENIGMENLKRVADVMCNAIQLDCGMKSDIEVGRKWNQRMSDEEVDAYKEEVKVVVEEEGEEDDRYDDDEEE